MCNIIWFTEIDKRIGRFIFFYKPSYEDISFPGGILRVISIPHFSSEAAKRAFQKKLMPLIKDSFLLPNDSCAFSVDIPVIEANISAAAVRNLKGLISSVPKERYRGGKINVVISGADDIKYVLPLIPDFQLNIISEKDGRIIEEQLLDEFGLSMHIEYKLSRRKMHGNLSVFFPGTVPPDIAGRDTILNLSGKDCSGSIDCDSITCFPPHGFEKVYSVCGGKIKNLFAILEYSSQNTDNTNMVIRGY